MRIRSFEDLYAASSRLNLPQLLTLPGTFFFLGESERHNESDKHNSLIFLGKLLARHSQNAWPMEPILVMVSIESGFVEQSRNASTPEIQAGLNAM